MKHLLTIVFIFFTIGLSGQTTSWNEYKLKEHWKTNGSEEIEGIYIRNTTKIIYNNGSIRSNWTNSDILRLFIIKENDKFFIKDFFNNFNGEITETYDANTYYITINKDELSHLRKKKYSFTRVSSSKFVIEETRVLDDDGNFKEVIKDTYTLEYKPETKVIDNGIIYSGTGFAISNDGIIVTNHHVVENAKTIKIRGVNADFSIAYNAKVIVSDKNNDLTLIQIVDNKFTKISGIPFKIKTGISGVGENIFVLGYPLRATMGDEIKLTNGIISSRTGFQGDISSYQISAPTQPGNSGGPLFDSQGDLIGIINAKHIGAENASYAIKAIYLKSLIEMLPNPPTSQTTNTLTGKTLTQQVELIKKFIYIIETE